MEESALPVIGQQNMELEDEMREMFNHLGPDLSADCCIYRVPYHLRKLNEESYTPTVISIGPFHHGDNRLQTMEREKVRCLKIFLDMTGLDLGVLLRPVRASEEKIRRFYGETIQLNSNAFVKMILLDVIFILQLFLSWPPFQYLQPWLRSALIRDFILLENQIPFFIIRRLLKITNRELENPRCLEVLTFDFFEVFVGPKPVSFPEGDILHFTDLLRTFQLPSTERRRRDRGGVVKHLYTVSQLHEAGVKFKVSSSKCLLDLNFSNKVLEIPCICLDGRTEILARNILAYEQCHAFADACIADYYVILHYLINTARDVDLLCDKKIISNCLGDSNAAMSLVNSLSKGLVLKSMFSDYCRLSDALNEFYANPRHSWKATLRREYFSTPWSTASTMAAVIFLVLTVIQTVCSIIQVVPKHK